METGLCPLAAYSVEKLGSRGKSSSRLNLRWRRQANFSAERGKARVIVSTTLNIYAQALPRENNGNADKLAELIYSERATALTDEPVVLPFPSAADTKT